MQRRAPDPRPSAAERGYDRSWRRNRGRYLRAHPVCLDCGAAAEVPDHWPVPRRDLVAAGDPHPDAWHHLQPRCVPCHNRAEATRAAAARAAVPAVVRSTDPGTA